MMKSTRLRNFVILLSCLCPLPLLASLGDPLAPTMISIPQHSSKRGEGGEPTGKPHLDEIITPEGSEIGEVKDFIIDLDTRCIAYIVGAFNHLRHQKDALFVIPWERVKLDPEMENFAFIGDEITLGKAPHFSPAAWRTQSLTPWIVLADRYWKKEGGLKGGRENGSQSTYSKASDLLGLNVQSTTGKNLGTIEAFLFIPETGEISYVLFSSETEKTESDKKFSALPWSALQAYAKQHFWGTERDHSHPSQILKGFCDTTFSDHSLAYCHQKKSYRKTIPEN